MDFQQVAWKKRIHTRSLSLVAEISPRRDRAMSVILMIQGRYLMQYHIRQWWKLSEQNKSKPAATKGKRGEYCQTTHETETGAKAQSVLTYLAIRSCARKGVSPFVFLGMDMRKWQTLSERSWHSHHKKLPLLRRNSSLHPGHRYCPWRDKRRRRKDVRWRQPPRRVWASWMPRIRRRPQRSPLLPWMNSGKQ